jgi:hypothetical protein
VTAAVSVNLVADVLDVFERHGLHYRDDHHTGRAAGLVQEAAMAYDTVRAIPSGTAVSGPAFAAPRLELLAQMCQDACACVTVGIETCENCYRFADGICPVHSDALARADAYRGLARQLGAPVNG